MLLNLLGIKIHDDKSAMNSVGQQLNDESLIRYLSKHDSILKCRAALLLEECRFKELYTLLSTHQFDMAHHSDLQLIWYKGHYAEAQKTRGRALGAVDKYRIRRKYPLPKTIWDGEETVYCFKVHIFKSFKRYNIMLLRRVFTFRNLKSMFLERYSPKIRK